MTDELIIVTVVHVHNVIGTLYYINAFRNTSFKFKYHVLYMQ